MSATGSAVGAYGANIGTGELRSWMGTQYDSRKETAPSIKFGSEAIPSQSPRKVGLSPGPIYMPSPRGKMGDGPAFTFGTGGAAAPSRRAGAAPGPGEYEVREAVGTVHASSTSHTAPQYGWGTGGRHQAAIGERPKNQACAEFYETSASIGPQPISTKKNVSAFAFGGAQRFDSGNRAANPASQNPGPGHYKLQPTIGVQASSDFKSNPVCGFSRAQRFRPRTSQEGGKHVKIRSSVGPQVLSDFKSKPVYGFGSARRFDHERPSTARDATPGPGSYRA